MKRYLMLWGVLVCLIVSLSWLALAAPEYEVVFDKEFMEPINPNPGRPFGIRSIVYLNNVFYAYIGNAIYSWEPGDPKPLHYCNLPQAPEWNDAWRNTPLQEIQLEERIKLEQSVDYIAGGDNALWGYNLLSGNIGKIGENGISWQEISLKTSNFFKDNLIALLSFLQQKRIHRFLANTVDLRGV